MAGITATTHSDDEILTVAEAAAEAHRSTRTIRRAYRTGKLPAFRDGNGRRVGIRYEDLRKWMMAKAAASPSPPEVERPVGEIRHRKHTKSRQGSSENLGLLRVARQRRRASRRAARA